MYLDVKVTVWQRIQIDEEVMPKERVLEILKDGTATDLWTNDHEPDWETLVDTETEMCVEDNDGFSTLELYDDDKNIIWENGKGNLNGVD